ncbi:MAG: 5-formyltetrahydrofolate cyclo-ligase [Promethearchaeota archaeon]
MQPRSAEKFKTKQEIREFVWSYLEKHNLVAFPRSCHGRVPNFIGAKQAASLFKSLPEFVKADTVFSAPDSSLHTCRAAVISSNKSLLVAAPRITGFYLLSGIDRRYAWNSTTIKGFSRFGKLIKLESLTVKVDLYLTGAVAVDKNGNRVGKGTGYGDREDALLSAAGIIDEQTPRVAVIHDEQLFQDFSWLMEDTDRKVTIMITPSQIIRI